MNRRGFIRLWALLGGAGLCGGGAGACQPRAFTEPFTLAGGKAIPAETLNAGRAVYLRNCYACHGEAGDGEGPAASTMRPPPRNLQHALFKFGGVAAGSLPVDDALDRTLRRGLHGTPMLAWDLPDRERAALVQYLKTFKLPGAVKSRWQEEAPGEPVEISPDPWTGREGEAVRRGEAVYHVQGPGHAGCAGCHAGYLPYARVEALTREVTGGGVPGFRPDYYRTDVRETQYPVRLDDAGELLQAHKILVPDFWVHPMKTAPPVGTRVLEGFGRAGVYTTAMQRQDIYRVIAAGVGGAAMPTWKGALPEENLWALAYYVQSLARMRGTPEAASARRALDAQPPWRTTENVVPRDSGG